MNPISAITQAVSMVAGGIEGGLVGSGNIPTPPPIVVPAPNYTPLILLGFGGLVALILWK